MGRFHYHADGTGHSHDDDDGDHEHQPASTTTTHDHHDGGVGDHSGYQTGGLRVEVLERDPGRERPNRRGQSQRLPARQVQVVNLMSSPGAGKTTLLREVLLQLGSSVRVGIVEGDVETSIDAERLAGLGAPVSLVNTSNGFGGECHLDATMVRSALPRLPLADLDLVVIENVGNLVCPAEFDVGEHARAMVFSVTEGEEKPLKYPVMFRSADVVDRQQDRSAPLSRLRSRAVPLQPPRRQSRRAHDRDLRQDRCGRRRGVCLDLVARGHG